MRSGLTACEHGDAERAASAATCSRVRRVRHGFCGGARRTRRDAASGSAPAAVAGPSLSWHSCSGPRQAMQCASVQVPLDYGNPGGRKITLALSRVPATAPASQRQGVLLVNPGGPGGSGLSLAGVVASGLKPECRRRVRHHRLRPARRRVEQAGAALRHVVLRRGTAQLHSGHQPRGAGARGAREDVRR